MLACPLLCLHVEFSISMHLLYARCPCIHALYSNRSCCKFASGRYSNRSSVSCSYILLKKLASLIPFLLAALILCVSSLCLLTNSCTPSPACTSTRSLLCSCTGTGFSSPAFNFAIFRSYFALDLFVMLATSTPPSSLPDAAGLLGSGTRVHSQGGYSWSSSARSGLGGCLR